MSRKWHLRVLSIMGEKWDNSNMEELMKTLERIGIPTEQRAAIRDHYDGDLDGLTMYVLYCVALFDDRHEYLD